MNPTCHHCGAEPDFPLAMDCVRFICTKCVHEAMKPGGRSLSFPRDVQDEFSLTENPEIEIRNA